MTDASIIDPAPLRSAPVSGSGGAQATGGTPEPSVRDYVSLLKPRVMSLVIFTAFAGMIAAPSGVNPVVGFAAILCIAVGAGASGMQRRKKADGIRKTSITAQGEATAR